MRWKETEIEEYQKEFQHIKELIRQIIWVDKTIEEYKIVFQSVIVIDETKPEEYQEIFQHIKNLREKIGNDPRLGYKGYKLMQELWETVRSLVKIRNSRFKIIEKEEELIILIYLLFEIEEKLYFQIQQKEKNRR